MKAACALAASLLAASTAALTTTAASVSAHTDLGEYPRSIEGNPSNAKAKFCVASSSEKEKFTPRFDGLRFIETLVTAHR